MLGLELIKQKYNKEFDLKLGGYKGAFIFDLSIKAPRFTLHFTVY